MNLEYKFFRAWMWRVARMRSWPAWVKIPCYVVLGIAFIVGWILAALPVALWSILRGIWFRFFPPPPTRDVSQLATDEDLDAVVETVEDEGEPIKECRQRLIHRDPRLLPKPKPQADVWPRPQSKRVMKAAEANRLFSETMRTRDRKIRDLLCDDQQLERLGLPIWRKEQDLARALNMKVSALRHFSIHRDRDRVCHYVTFAIAKRNGSQRLIMAPKRRLKAIQKTMLRELVSKLPVSEAAHGFLPGRSIRSGATPHVGQKVLLKLDLRDFFPSVTFARVRGFLIAVGYSFPVATTLAVLMTEAERQPVEVDGELFYVPAGQRFCVQGAPTSPGLCNSICQRLDRRLAGLAWKYDWQFTRYADDLTFSGNTPEAFPAVYRLAKHICRDEGFEINRDKTRIMRRGQRQRVTGVTVNDNLGLSRRERRHLRAVIHRMKTNDPAKPATISRDQLEGKLAYLQMLNAKQANAIRKQL
jgi:retron-type reverse transcriptase